MRQVGLRELKNRLSYYVQLVKAGERLEVTDRGQAVVELLPAGAADRGQHPGLMELERRGLVRPGRGKRPGRYPTMPRVLPPGMLQRLLDEDRGER